MSEESVENVNEEIVSEETIDQAVANESTESNETVEDRELTADEIKAAKKAEKEAAKAAKAAKKKEKKKDPLKEANEEIANLNDKILRLHAEYDNFRKRTAKDLRSSREAGVVDTIMPFLQVYDHMKMAAMSIENGDNMDAVRQGVSMIVNEFKRAVSELSVDEIDALGKAFDPNLHAAVAHESSEDVEEGQVLKQWSVGYKKGDRLLKPAKVVVSSGPEIVEEPSEEITEEKGGE